MIKFQSRFVSFIKKNLLRVFWTFVIKNLVRQRPKENQARETIDRFYFSSIFILVSILYGIAKGRFNVMAPIAIKSVALLLWEEFIATEIEEKFGHVVMFWEKKIFRLLQSSDWMRMILNWKISLYSARFFVYLCRCYLRNYSNKQTILDRLVLTVFVFVLFFQRAGIGQVSARDRPQKRKDSKTWIGHPSRWKRIAKSCSLYSSQTIPHPWQNRANLEHGNKQHATSRNRPTLPWKYLIGSTTCTQFFIRSKESLMSRRRKKRLLNRWIYLHFVQRGNRN